MLAPLDLLEEMLNTPPRLIFTCRETFTGSCTGRQRISSHRYIRILRGKLRYCVDQTEAALGEGTALFVARGSLRHWEVLKGEVCEIVWCEFETPGVNPDPHILYHTDDSQKGFEKAALLRLWKLWKFPRHLRAGTHGDPALPRATALMMEGELKASLARFWTSARRWEGAGMRRVGAPARSHPAVRKSLAWLEENYREPHAHRLLFSEIIDLSPNHFRLLFTRQVGISVSAHLMNLRMREAIHLLRTSSLSVKEVAGSVGFNDPLYFSRCFHQHWDIAPTRVRKD